MHVPVVLEQCGGGGGSEAVLICDVCVCVRACVNASSILTPRCDWQLQLIVKTGQIPSPHVHTVDLSVFLSRLCVYVSAGNDL